MTDRFSYSVAARDGKARAGKISTPRGDIRTPAFMPVGTAATVVMLTVGTGVGSAVMVDGRLHSGRRSLVEMGHIPVAVGAMRDQDGSDDACSCGQEG